MSLLRVRWLFAFPVLAVGAGSAQEREMTDGLACGQNLTEAESS